MTHSIDEGITLPFNTQSFRESVKLLIARSGVRHTANLLKTIGLTFEEAYELIFNKKPRD